MLSFLFIILAYFLGAIPTGYLIAKARGIDIQKMGSGNIGATNVLRSVGVVPAIIVVIMDPIKGFVAALLPSLFGLDAWTIAFCAIFAVIGNNLNVFLRFRGGKGIATSLGAFLAIDPIITLLVAIIGISTIALGRYVSLGSLVGVLSAPVMLVSRGNFAWSSFFALIAFTLLAFWRHWSNIKKLAAGTERRLGEKASADSATPTQIPKDLKQQEQR